MKKGLFLCFLLLEVAKGFSQISDLDAKLAFQKITDSYESSSYQIAVQQCDELEQKMGSWNPKLLYMYLESAYQFYIHGGKGTGFLDEGPSAFNRFKYLSDTFFNIIDEDNYPKDKYNEMTIARMYFIDMAKKVQNKPDR